MSKDIVEYILINKSNLNYNLMDDVAIGKLLDQFSKTELNRYNMPETFNMIEMLPLFKDHYHIRVKSSNRNTDVITMNTLFNVFYTK